MSERQSNRLTSQQIVEQLWAPNEAGETPNVYAILDGARDERIEPLVNNSGLEHACLYAGRLSYALKRAAPHIVKLEASSSFTRTLLQEGWGNSWGIFAIAYPPVTLAQVRNSCRRIAKAISPQGKPIAFRYYDPRVLRPYLPTCTQSEADHVFTHISDFIVEGDADRGIYRFRRVEEAVQNVMLGDTLSFPPAPVENHWGKGAIRGPLKLRAAQYQPFIDLKLQSTILKAESHIENCFPEKAAELKNHNELRAWVKRNVEQTLSLGFSTMQEILRVLNAVVQYGESAYDSDWFKAIMARDVNYGVKSSAIENAIIDRIEALQKRAQNTLSEIRQGRIMRFRNDNIFKLETIGKVHYGLEFSSKDEARNWLTSVAESSLDHQLKNSDEMSLWLDLAMAHGQDFHLQPWASAILLSEQTPQNRLLELMKMQPKRDQWKRSIKDTL